MPKQVWDDTLYVTIYDLTLQGYGREKIGEVLGISLSTLRYWWDTKPALRHAVELGKERRKVGEGKVQGATEQFFQYCYRRLPADLKEIWDRIMELEKRARDENKDASLEDVRAMFAGQGTRVRQHLFIHAMVSTNFKVTEACRLVGISRDVYDRWLEKDEQFAELAKHILTMKKDWAEGRLMDLVAKGDTPATIFVNKTLNRDRGYDPRVTVQHEHKGSVLHGHMDLEKLLPMMSPTSQRELLEAMRNYENQLATGNGQAVALPAHAAAEVFEPEGEEREYQGNRRHDDEGD